MELTTYQRALQRHLALKNDRKGLGWDAHWQEVAEYLAPRNGRFYRGERNRGDKKHTSIYDNTALRALNTLTAGLMAGMTSPARPWFRLTTSDPLLDESAAVKKWLADTTRLMLMIFGKSNVYRALHTMYGELGAFGTASSMMLGDFKNVVHLNPMTVGEYTLATDYNGNVHTMTREFEVTVEQAAEEFGKDKLSTAARNLLDNNKLDALVPITQVIAPRKVRDSSKRDAKNMAWQSVYIEPAGGSESVLRDSGFKIFPGLCPRWMTVSGDVYGHSPGMEALGDIKALQHEQLRKAQGIDYMTKPPLQVPTALKNSPVNSLPGGSTYFDAAAPGAGIRPMFEVRLDLNHLLADIQDVRERIKGSFYADLFLMLANGTNTQMTATEVAERHEEKLLMLGPVLERLHNEILDPLIELTFNRMVESGILPTPPQEMQGRELNVEFVSMLAQAQRAIATNSVDRYVGNLGVVAGIKPDVLDKFDADHWADTYADMLGIDPELIVPGDKVAMIRSQRAQAQQQAAQAEQMGQAADAAAKLGGISTAQPNMLTDATRAFSGYM